jgi:manganese/iron transport system permease protein
VDWLLDPLSAPYVRRALLALVLLALAGGLLGAWIVLRRLAFFTHAVGTATFPGLVVAGPWGLAPPVAALGAALLYATSLAGLLRDRRLGADAATGLLLVAALALGSILASDVYSSGAGVDRQLFGTLLGCLALTVVATLPAVGALLVSTILVVPSATARLVARTVPGLLAGGVALAVAEGVAGVWLSWYTDVPPGPAIAVVGGVVFAVAAAAVAARGARPVAEAGA